MRLFLITIFVGGLLVGIGCQQPEAKKTPAPAAKADGDDDDDITDSAGSQSPSSGSKSASSSLNTAGLCTLIKAGNKSKKFSAHVKAICDNKEDLESLVRKPDGKVKKIGDVNAFAIELPLPYCTTQRTSYNEGLLNSFAKAGSEFGTMEVTIGEKIPKTKKDSTYTSAKYKPETTGQIKLGGAIDLPINSTSEVETLELNNLHSVQTNYIIDPKMIDMRLANITIAKDPNESIKIFLATAEMVNEAMKAMMESEDTGGAEATMEKISKAIVKDAQSYKSNTKTDEAEDKACKQRNSSGSDSAADDETEDETEDETDDDE